VDGRVDLPGTFQNDISEAKVDKDAPEVLIILLDAVIEGFDTRLIQEAQHTLFKLTAPLAGDDLDQLDALVNRFLDDALQLGINVTAPVIDGVQVQLELCHI
jgi:hypothetical protein